MLLWERQRFWRLVERRGADECWLWRGASGSGYGRFKMRGVLYSPHRIAYTLVKGPIPRDDSYHGPVVMHSCDNPGCVNPAHLSLGSMKDNVRDMIDKGRKAVSGPVTRLTPEQLHEIREGNESQRVLARKFGVCSSTIFHHRRRFRAQR